jgi:hypothetical protein
MHETPPDGSRPRGTPLYPRLLGRDGSLFRDKEGTYRDAIHTRWWDTREGLTISDLAMPPGNMKVDPEVRHHVQTTPQATLQSFRPLLAARHGPKGPAGCKCHLTRFHCQSGRPMGGSCLGW